MIRRGVVLALAIATCGCAYEPSGPKKPEPVVAAPVATADTPSTEIPAPWSDQAILKFIDRSPSPLVAEARHRGEALSWITDRILETDSATYKVVEIGHTASEPDGSNPRFVPNAWIYLDTGRRRIYEYDLANDSLVRWE